MYKESPGNHAAPLIDYVKFMERLLRSSISQSWKRAGGRMRKAHSETGIWLRDFIRIVQGVPQQRRTPLR